ncbi:restriction endonuclease subunit S [Staphylococcus equorum]|uniref:restriction endonuclease subunit S n=1 Tax=Staphylococcus equorum TaxID=246432 RepID=UPI00080745A1|nr:restriction endonuclease subunit S [Staphylococcus equorum]
MTNEVKNVPELRFPGFEGEWGSSELGNIAENYIGGGTPSTKVKEYWNGNIPWIQSSDLKIDDVKHMEFHKYINRLAIENSSAKLIPKNSIAIVTRVGVGKLALIREEFSTSQDFLSLSNLSLDTNYALYALYKLIRKESTKLQGTSIKGLTKNDLLSKHIKIPSYINEQEQIGDFFSKLDRQIELEEQKLEKLEEQKKGYMQKIFSQELRFKDENDNYYPEWRKEIIGNIATTFSGGTPSSTNSNFYNGSIPFIRSGEIYKNSTELMINERAISNSSAKIVKVGDLLYALYGATSGEVAISKINGAINQAVLCIRSQESVDYLFNYLKMKKDQILKTYIQGGQGNLSASIIKKIDIDLPSIEEQKKIGSFLNKLDELINKHNQKIDGLKKRKKGFLQKMFV